MEPYIHPSAHMRGDVEIGPGSIIFPGARIDGSKGPVRIGSHVAVEDNCVLAAGALTEGGNEDTGELVIGDNVIIGHSAIIYGSNIGCDSLIGIKARVNPACQIGDFCRVAAGAILHNGSILSSYSVAMGVPAVIRDSNLKIADRWTGIPLEDLRILFRIILDCLDGEGKINIHPEAVVHPDAVLIGNVDIGADSVIESGVVLRGDFGKIVVGNQVTISEKSVLHAGDPESLSLGSVSELVIGDRVRVGRGVVLNGKSVGSDTVIQDDAFMLHHARIGNKCKILAESGVMTRMSVPDGHAVSGVPGKILTG